MKRTISTVLVGLTVMASAWALGGCVVRARPAPVYTAQPAYYGRPAYARPAYVAPRTQTTTTVYYR